MATVANGRVSSVVFLRSHQHSESDMPMFDQKRVLLLSLGFLAKLYCDLSYSWLRMKESFCITTVDCLSVTIKFPCSNTNKIQQYQMLDISP